MSKELIAIISEGEKTEKQIIENIKKNFFSDDQEIEFLPFRTNIYGLWDVLKKDEFETDIIEVLKERESDIAEKFKDLSKNDISQIFLFFDYDGHAKKNEDDADDIVAEMIEIFNNETELGKIYISYPMVESLKHLKKNELDYKQNCVPAKENIRYKNIVSEQSDYQNLTLFTLDDWYFILRQNLKKANFILFSIFELPNLNFIDYQNTFNQSSIFKYQRKNFINVNQTVAVLSAFPFFLIDYFGNNFLTKITTIEDPHTSNV
ncbi:hypothetical protein V7124_07665 [Neobacillus niacini]|uniref:hypothetical protein n=1 Tax=Neobacillus niacini TaxID=86668 RepID=UPI00300014C1